jgi:LPPG:FO 2-phospho-L-lactate transferase
MGIVSRILPMSDAPIVTRVLTENGELAFQEYFVRLRHNVPVKSVKIVGAENAQPAPGIVDAIANCQTVLIAPSNPITSIGPILAVPGIREALRDCKAPVVGISPIMANAAVSGPAAALMQAQGFEVSLSGIWQIYGDILDVLIGDSADLPLARKLESSGKPTLCTSILMRNLHDRVHLARTAIDIASQPLLGRVDA